MRISKLKQLAQERGVSEDEIVRHAIENSPSVIQAAAGLELTPSAIFYHLLKHNLRVHKVTRLEVRKAEQP